MIESIQQAMYVRFRARTYGPFSGEELVRMVKRGQITRLHELSADKLVWHRAGDDESLFPKPMTAPVPSPSAASQSQSPEDNSLPIGANGQTSNPVTAAASPPGSSEEWFYSVDGQRHGPVSAVRLIDLYRSLQITEKDSVWRLGMPEWISLADANVIPLKAGDPDAQALPGRRQNKHRLIYFVALLVVGVIFIAAGIVTWHVMRSQGTMDQAAIRESVGMVVSGVEITTWNGEVRTYPGPHGSCFAISRDGAMLTNKHVVKTFIERSRRTKKNAAILEENKGKIEAIEDKLWVFIDGERMACNVVWISSRSDIAIIRVNRAFAKPFRMSASEQNLLDTDVKAIGFPASAQVALSEREEAAAVLAARLKAGEIAGLYESIESYYKQRDFQFVLTSGRISQVTRDSGTNESWLFHTAAISGGNSGGPLVNQRGTVVGVNTAVPKVDAGVPVLYALGIGQFRTDIDSQVKDVAWEALTDTTGPSSCLSYAASDIERRLGFPAGRFTQAGPVLPLVAGIVLMVGLYATLIPFKDYWINHTFTRRGWIPYATVFLSCWAFMIVIIKSRKVALQHKAISIKLVPADVDFVLSVGTAAQVIDRMHQVVDDYRQFLLFNRIHLALSNLRNMGRIGDVDDVLRSQAQADESMMESGYTVVRGLIWAIPVLGFIGTVLGLSQAIEAFTSVLARTTDVESIKQSLQAVTAGLATAFETTLHALVAAVVIQLLLTMVKRSEERMLDEFLEYCQRDIVARLRLHSDAKLEDLTGDAKISQ